MRVALLANPVSGRGRGPARAREIARALHRRGHEAEVRLGRSRADAAAWAREAAAGAERLVVVGGDGSLNAVCQGLPRDTPPLALVPLGTSNLLGREWGLPRDPETVAELVESGRTRLLDTGVVNGIRSFLVWDFGLGGELIRRMEMCRAGPIRKGRYLPLLFRTVRDWKPAPQLVVADGQELGRFEYGIVAGVRSYASSLLQLGPMAYDDGWWELYLLPRIGFRNGTWLALHALLRRIQRCPGVIFRRVRRVEVLGDSPLPVQVDGDFVGTTPVRFAVSDFRLPLLAPRVPATPSLP